MTYIRKRQEREMKKCLQCNTTPLKPTQLYDWYSPMDGSYIGIVCKKCAKRELGSKNKHLRDIL